MGSQRQVILDVAEECGADLIVVGSHGYGFWSRALIGWVSLAIAAHAKCSVMIVRQYLVRYFPERGAGRSAWKG